MNKVTLSYDPAWTALEWAKKHSASYVRNDVHKLNDWPAAAYGDMRPIDYFFGEEKDAVLFSLKWL